MRTKIIHASILLLFSAMLSGAEPAAQPSASLDGGKTIVATVPATLPGKCGTLNETMLAWREWYQQQTRGAVPVEIKETRYLGPVLGKDLDRWRKPLTEWTAAEMTDWKTIDLVADRPEWRLYPWTEQETLLALSLTLDAKQVGPRWIAVEAGQDVDMLLNGKQIACSTLGIGNLILTTHQSVAWKDW